MASELRDKWVRNYMPSADDEQVKQESVAHTDL
jgi:hypothetical protein